MTRYKSITTHNVPVNSKLSWQSESFANRATDLIWAVQYNEPSLVNALQLEILRRVKLQSWLISILFTNFNKIILDILYRRAYSDENCIRKLRLSIIDISFFVTNRYEEKLNERKNVCPILKQLFDYKNEKIICNSIQYSII